MKRTTAHRPSGIILLVVLSMLTFFSVLVAAYVIFSNQHQRSSFSIATRDIKRPNTNAMMNEALMLLIRGTNNGNNPFFGEDLLSDYYGRKDALALTTIGAGIPVGTSGFVKVPVSSSPPDLDDLFAGRIITFRKGVAANRSFRVIRSLSLGSNQHELIIQLSQDLVAADIESGIDIWVNGVPRNSPGIGYTTGANLNQIATKDKDSANADVGYMLPVSLQPNHLSSAVDKSTMFAGQAGDFDESGDAADYNNWFLSYRRSDGKIIPSFHRPSVINYILNEEPDWSSIAAEPLPLNATPPTPFSHVMASIARATMRPLPIAKNQFGTNVAINEKFTGGNPNFALRSPIPVSDKDRLDQIAKVLTGAVANPYDVDNDFDGITDSVWIDLGLPVFTSPEGKLLKPLVAPMIEDLSARLDVNAHGGSLLGHYDSNVTQLATLWRSAISQNKLPADPHAFWAGTRGVFSNTSNARNVFRGIGYGPAEIMFPSVSNSGVIADTTIIDNLSAMVNDRYRLGSQVMQYPNLPGVSSRDALDVLRTGFRPQTHTAAGGYGRSIDPFGRGGVGIGRNGDLVSSQSGQLVKADDTGTAEPDGIDEAVNDPYEFDPAGSLNGDSQFTLAELESILRSNEFSSELLPLSLRNRVATLIENFPEFRRSLTTKSVSDDSLPPIPDSFSPYTGLIDLIETIGGTTLTPVQHRALFAPELRLGRKLDVNRPLGNGIDDNNPGQDGFGVIDEPRETIRAANNGIDDNNDSVTDEPGELGLENQAFVVRTGTGTVPTSFANKVPNYTLDDPAIVPVVVPPNQYSWDQNTGRQILARHLFVLLMALSSDGLDIPATGSIPFTASEADLYKSRRLAQWAINVVDYRDPDSIMSRFAFDPNPFDGWDVAFDSDGDGTSDLFEGNATLATHPTPSPTVWGVEAPELVFSESAAFHDVRLRDTDNEVPSGTKTDDGSNPDDDSDQVRVPQGSVFLELYCPHAPVNGDQTTKPGAPQELYTTLAGGVSELDLARTAPAVSGTHRLPVWRLAFSEPHFAGSTKANLNPELLRNTLPDTASFEHLAPNEIEPPLTAGNALKFTRFVWFAPFANYADIEQTISDNSVADMTANQVFFPPTDDVRESVAINTDRFLEPGQFLVIAPREITHLGSKEILGTFPGAPSQQRFEVSFDPNLGGLIQYERGQIGFTTGSPSHDGGGIRVTPLLISGASETNANYTAALPLIVGTFRPAGWPANAFEDGYVGLNVSEPLPRDSSGAFTYYKTPIDSASNPVFRSYNGNLDNDGVNGIDYQIRDAYLDFSDPTNSPPEDEPRDLIEGILPPDSTGKEPLLGTIEQYSSVFLQRLADPTVPYNSVTNPYRTVDWIPLDLTVFSGEEDENKINRIGPPSEYATSTRQRNGVLLRRDNTGTAIRSVQNSLFSYETSLAPKAQINSTEPDFFSLTTPERFIKSSLSFLNTQTTGNLNRSDESNISDVRSGRSNPGFTGFAPSIGAEGAPSNNVSGNDRNLPQATYAIHPWLNRPFASHFELMMVPACSQGRLFEEFAFHVTAGDPDIYPNSNAPDDPVVFNASFRHLLNFFHSSFNPAEGAQFVRLFDFVNTLPRFRGEVEMINPDRILGTDLDPLLAQPFNFLYPNRRHGTINLNTVAEFPVWAGLMHGHLNDTEYVNPDGNLGNESQLAFNRFRLTRRGYDNGTERAVNAGPGPYNYAADQFDPRFPTQFAGAFCNSIATPYAPVLRSTVDTDLLRRRGVNGTLLRGSSTLDVNDPPGPPPNFPTKTSLFVRDSTQTPIADIHLSRDRSPFMRYQTLMRMPNLVSDNSQVFVIRLTLGMFEVDTTNVDSLGAEYNAGIGQNQRFQAMFIVDRSIPVGFIPGQDTNARDVVIFESYAQ